MVVTNSESPSPSFQMCIENGEQNHRKRRRNRMRVSCLNCYASKRKCDRKRPCTRCIKHGLTGLCVYELDDPNPKDKSQIDETTRLRNRIAELESVIRELNNRPHPRWFAPGGVKHDPSLIGLRRGTRRRVKAPENYARSASVEAFFDAIADEDSNEEELKIKVEQEAFTPEFTPSEAGPSRSSVESPLTPLSPLLDSPLPHNAPLPISRGSSVSHSFGSFSPTSPVSAPFSFHDGPHMNPSEISPPLSSFVQGTQDGTVIHSCSSARPTADGLSPAPSNSSDSSDEGPPLAMLFPMQDDIAIPPFTGGFSKPLSLHPSVTANHASIGIQTSPFPARSTPVSHSVSPSFSQLGTCQCQPNAHSSGSVCQCLTNPIVYNPLVNFANALRTSREALENLHPPLSTCVLFRRITELDEHIFSASPPTPPTSPKLSPAHDFFSSVYASPKQFLEPTLAPSSPPMRALDSGVRHAHSHSLPFYSPPTFMDPIIHEDQFLGPPPFTTDLLMSPNNAPVYPQLRGWT